MKFQNEFIFLMYEKFDLKMLLKKQKVIGIGGFTLLAKKDWMLKIDKISKLIMIVDLFKM